jgi:hypothetical protein
MLSVSTTATTSHLITSSSTSPLHQAWVIPHSRMPVLRSFHSFSSLGYCFHSHSPNGIFPPLFLHRPLHLSHSTKSAPHKYVPIGSLTPLTALLTSCQYFMWYIVLLPFYLPTSSLLRSPKVGFTALGAWVLTQAAWLQQGYELEFLGNSTFFPGLWGSALTFFVVNCWLLGVIVGDIKDRRVISGKKLN